jgi:hypothetical protein
VRGVERAEAQQRLPSGDLLFASSKINPQRRYSA